MRILKAVLFIVVTLILLLFLAIQVRWKRTFDAPTPDLKATSDSATIAHGRYLAYAAAGCAYCHVPKADWAKLEAGEQPPLSGNHVFPLPFGVLHSPNLTPDATTGIGRRTDGEIARILRHGVRADHRAAFPFMEFQHLSDADVIALLSFLRSQPAVANEVPDMKYNLMGKALMSFMIAPTSAATPPPAQSPVGPSVERGEYLANYVSSCVACHTNRDKTGKFVGQHFAGGQVMDIEADPGHVYVTPNLTPDPTTGHISRMTDDDLRSIYRYLRSLPAAVNAVGEIYRVKD